MQFRQGDVLVEKVSEKTANVNDKEVPTLAEGEVSGHFHRVFGDTVHMYVDDQVMSRNAQRDGLNPYSATLEVGGGGAALRHVNRDGSNTGEHDPIDLVGGTYYVINQREYDPEAERRAAD